MAKDTVKEAVKQTSEQKFKKEQFIKNAEALGYEKYIVVGALCDCNKDELTKSEFDNLVKKFLGKKVN